MNVDNVDNVESTWRIKLCATAKNGEISYIIAKNMKIDKILCEPVLHKNPHAIRI